MASAIDICNLALSRLGDDATVSSIDPPEGSQQAEHCARFWPIACGTILASHEWGFATRTRALAQFSEATAGWLYAYSLPSDYVKVVRVTGPAAGRPADYEMGLASGGNTILLTNQPQALLAYVANVTDTVRYPALFIDALAWLLASHLAGPLIKGETGTQAAQAAYRAYEGVLSKAIAVDIEQHRPAHPDVRTPWIEDR